MSPRVLDCKEKCLSKETALGADVCWGGGEEDKPLLIHLSALLLFLTSKNVVSKGEGTQSIPYLWFIGARTMT